MIEMRQRKELYDKFRQGAIPSGADFANFIRSQLNLLDDGIDVSDDPNEPVGLRAHGEDENYLDLSDRDGKQRWRVSGRSEVNTEGLNLKADYNSKFFVERESGNVGISTDRPGAKLHIKQISATDAFRVDDEGSDDTPFIIASGGNVGVGVEEPAARLHISSSASGAVLRVDDNSGDPTPFLIDDRGNVGVGVQVGSGRPESKLTVMGGVAIGDNRLVNNNDLYVHGAVEVAGSIRVTGGTDDIGELQVKGPVSSLDNELTLKDNVRIMGGDEDGSEGNLSVQGNTTLGTWNRSNILTVNGEILSGGDPDTVDEQYELTINNIFSVNRDPGEPVVKVTGTTHLGDNQGNDYIYLNGTVQREGGEGVIIDDSLEVTGHIKLGDVMLEHDDTTLQVQTNARVDGTLHTGGDIFIKGVKAADINVIAPVGTVVAWLPGSYVGGSFQPAGGIALSDNWRECNGGGVPGGSPLGSGNLPVIDDSRFLMGSSGSLGARGGDNNALAHTHNIREPGSHSVSNPTITIEPFALQESHMPRHRHKLGIPRDESGGGVGNYSLNESRGKDEQVVWQWWSDYQGGGQAHTHGVSGGGGSSTLTHSGGAVLGVRESLSNANLPRYVAVKYIMRVK